MEYAAPKATISAHKVSFNNPIVSSIPLDESDNTQNASRKMAGVRISAGLICGRYFFMGSLLVEMDIYGSSWRQMAKHLEELQMG